MQDFGVLNPAFGVYEFDPAGPVLFHFVYLIINLTRKRDCTSGNKVMDSISILSKRKPIQNGSFCKGNLFICINKIEQVPCAKRYKQQLDPTKFDLKLLLSFFFLDHLSCNSAVRFTKVDRQLSNEKLEEKNVEAKFVESQPRHLFFFFTEQFQV